MEKKHELKQMAAILFFYLDPLATKSAEIGCVSLPHLQTVYVWLFFMNLVKTSNAPFLLFVCRICEPTEERWYPRQPTPDL